VQAKDLDRLRFYAQAGGKEAFGSLLARAGQLLTADPTPEPAVRGSARDPKTVEYWWSNRLQTVKALQEAEILAFVWLITREEKYGRRAREFTLKLAAWDPDGPTNFDLNCEAAKPMLYRLARAYDWTWSLLSQEERARVRAVLLRRALDAWRSGEVKEGAGHLNQPYNSHGNRTWHKLAENAVATYGETPQSEMFLRYAVTKFFAAYPVWSDDEGGWHEGLSYFAGYMAKVPTWLELARIALGIDGFKKPFFAHFGDYPLYSAPPGSPDLGFGDLAFRPPSAGWAFMHYFVRATGNPYWAWWANTWKIPTQSDEPVLEFLWSAAPGVAPKPPSGLPPSKIFRGIGVAILNTSLLSSAENVQLRFKSSPMGRWSHGHDPHNSFTLNAYGAALLVNNVYRDIYGSPFHRDWVWSTRSQNALLVDGAGQKSHSADLGGRILKWDLQNGLDYVVGDATAAYEGRLKRFWRHIFFVKPDVIVIADEVEAARPSTFQWMLHAQAEFQVDEARQRLTLDRGAAGVIVDYASERPLKLRQWTGYDPEPDAKFIASSNFAAIPPQWHVEAQGAEKSDTTLTFTILRVFRPGQAPVSRPVVERNADAISVKIRGAGETQVGLTVRRNATRDFALVQRGRNRWTIGRP